MIKRIKIKDKLAKLFKQGRINKEIFTRFRNKLTSQLRNAKSQYFQLEFRKSEGNIKKTWKIINSNIRKTLRNKNINLKENENEINTAAVPNKFSDYFSNIADQLVSEITPANRNESYYLKTKNINSFFMIPIVGKEIELSISALKSSGSYFSISSSVLENVKDSISDILAYIF